MEIEKILFQNVCWFDYKLFGLIYFEFDMYCLYISEIIFDYVNIFDRLFVLFVLI